MPGSGANVQFDPYPTPLSDYAVPVVVCRFDRSQPAGQRYVPLPNVYCRGIQRREGPDPGSARFEYVFSDSDPTAPYPTQFEQVWPLTAQGSWVVANDDELVVLGFTASGAKRVLFHGFASIPQVDVVPDAQSVTFVAVGVAVRAWDNPIGGASYRQGDVPHSTDETFIVATDLPTRFNPSGSDATLEPNCTPDDADVGPASTGWPAFLDPAIDRDPDPRTYWTCGKGVRYTLTKWNTAKDANDELWVRNPDFTAIDTVLQARTPKDGAEFYDPNDSTTYDAADIVLRDYDATNRAWPDVVAELCGFAGAVVRFELTQDENDEPVTTLRCRRGDADSRAPKDVYLAEPGDLDAATTNVGELHVARDAQAIANQFVIETDPIDFEVSIVLAPGFIPLVADATDAGRKQYLLSALTDASSETREAYRLYVADEAGDGHWDYDTAATVTNEPIDLAPVFGDPGDDGPTYVNRCRKPESTLITRDTAGHALKATLMLSRDYAGACPAVWDGTGHWQPISGGWQLLKDRIGILVTCDDPEAWDIGKYTGANPQNPGRTLRGITSQANPSATDQNTKKFFLMLTVRIPGDSMLAAQATFRDASPTQFRRARRVDCKDHFRQEIVAAHSWFNQTAKPVNSRDDTDKAEAHAEALRAAHELPPVEGSVTIPALVNSYDLADRIRMVAGRDATFQSNAGTSSGEAPRYPYVVEIDWDFAGNAQRTTLHFSDRRLEPQRA